VRFRGIVQYLMGQCILLGFATVNTWFPHYWFYFILGYFLLMIGIMGAQSAKALSRQKRAKSEASTGKRLFKAKLSEVNQAMMKDVKLKEDLKAQFSTIFVMFLPIMIIFMIFGPLKDVIVGANPEPGTLRTFIGYIVLYESLFIISFSTRIAASVNVRRRGFSMLQVPSEYIVTDKGIIGTNVAYTFPIKTKRLECNEDRGFVEFDITLAQSGAGGGVTRVRLYTRRPKDLYEILKGRVIIEGG